MNPLNEVKIQERRRIEMMAQAEIDRLLRPHPHPPAPPTRTYHILLARFGDVLYRWGCNLRTRYGQTVQPASGRT